MSGSGFIAVRLTGPFAGLTAYPLSEMAQPLSAAKAKTRWRRLMN